MNKIIDNDTYRGIVIYYNLQKHFGYIESENNKYYFKVNIFELKVKNKLLKEQGITKINTKFILHDEVSFRLIANENRLEAVDVRFIQNTVLDNLVSELKNENALYGYLKKIGNKYFVKHIISHIFFPVSMSRCESNITVIYEQILNNKVEFTLINTNQKSNVQAIIIDDHYKRFQYIVKSFENNILVNGTIKSKIKGGFIVDLDGIDAFLPFSLADIVSKNTDNYIGQNLMFEIIKVHHMSENIMVSRKLNSQYKEEYSQKSLDNDF